MKTNTVAPRDIAPAFGASIEGTWLVNTRAGILSLTLDQLDQMFQRGEVNAKTPVFTSGMTAWDTLGAIADLDDAGGDAAAVPSARIVEEVMEVEPEPIEGGSYPPTSAGVFGAEGLPWANGAPTESEGYTLVRRSTGVIPFSIRKAAGAVADYVADLRLSRPRLAAAGPWLFGAALSGIFIFSLYQLGAASTRPGAHTKSGWITARTTPTEARPAAAATPVVIGTAPSDTAPSSAPLPAPAPAGARARDEFTTAAAPPRQDDEPSAVAVLRTADLRLAAPTRADASVARSARAKAKAAKAGSARKAKARATRATGKRASKRKGPAFLY